MRVEIATKSAACCLAIVGGVIAIYIAMQHHVVRERARNDRLRTRQ